MGMVHQKGKLNTPFQEKQLRSATPSSPRSGKLGSSERLAQEIRALVQSGGLSARDAAKLVDETASAMTLLLAGKLFGFTASRLERIRAALAKHAHPSVRRTR